MWNIFTYIFLLIVSCKLIAQNRLEDLPRVITNNTISLSVTRYPDNLLKNRAPVTPVLVLPKRDTAKATTRFRCYLPKNRNEPLLVVDGTIMEMNFLSRVDINAIQDVTVLGKNESVAIFGPDGAAGSVIISTKEQSIITLNIRDFLDGTALPGATISFISYDKRDTLMIVADSTGLARTDELNRNKGWSVQVTSSGYKPFTGQLSYINKKQEILLEREVRTGPEAIIAAAHVRRISCYFRYHIPDSTKNAKESEGARGLNIYPNPVKRGQPLNVRLTKGVFPEGLWRVLSFDGRLLMTVPVSACKNQDLVQLSTDQRWAAGIYLLQLVYANGQVGASEKIIIQ